MSGPETTSAGVEGAAAEPRAGSADGRATAAYEVAIVGAGYVGVPLAQVFAEAGRRVVLAKPRTYMNLSGGPVAGLLRYYSVPVTELVVVHDELDLGFGVVRLKRGGGEGGHNGLRSISRSIGTRDYLRVRFGIGRPPGRQDPADYVLRRFSAIEAKDLDEAIGIAAKAPMAEFGTVEVRPLNLDRANI